MTAPSASEVAQHAAARYEPRPIDGELKGRHIISVEQFARADLEAVCVAAAELRRRVRTGDSSVLRLCRRKIMASLFYEASTRTDMSFQSAMLRMGGEVIATSGGVQFSSVYKGENLADTIRAVGCYADLVVLRHPEVRSSYEAAHHLDQLASRIGWRSVVISAGDGVGEHPTQALLDLFTIVDRLGGTDGLSITFVGDLANGRTVHSLAKLMALYGAQRVRLNFVSPESLRLPPAVHEFIGARSPDIELHETSALDDVLADSDVIYWTRVQEERFEDRSAYDAIADRYIMTPALLARARPGAILMHPLPRKHEMGSPADHAILDADPRSVYFHQMQNGMFVRMALVAGVLGASV